MGAAGNYTTGTSAVEVKRATPEQDFHVTAADYLRRALPSTTPWTTIAHGAYLGDGIKTFKDGRRIPIRVLRAAKLERMGLRPGWPDIIILASRFVGLELKSRWGVLSDDQRAVHALIRGAGGEVYVVKTLDEIEAALWREKISLRCRIGT